MERSGRLVRLSIAAVLGGIVTFTLLLPGIYVLRLAHPGCDQSPEPLSDQSPPEEHWIPIRDGRLLRIWYYPPKNGAVIMTFGGLGGSLGNALPPVGFLLDHGYGVVQVDQRGCAQPAAAVSLGANEEQDAESVIDFLDSQPDVRNIGAFGFSMGGVTAIRSAARNHRIAAVVAEGGYYNLGDDFIETRSRLPILERIFLYIVAGEFWLYHGINPWLISPVDDLPQISPRPVFLIYGENEVESGHAMQQFQAAHDPKKLWIVPGGAHGTNSSVVPEQYQKSVLEFLDQYLLP